MTIVGKVSVETKGIPIVSFESPGRPKQSM
jgi:hypothetical protein